MATSTVLSTVRTPLISRETRAYFAPVNRTLKQPTIFDPAVSATFDLNAPPAPWISLGCVEGVVRSADSKLEPVLAGVPAFASAQVRSQIGATLALRFLTWSKLTMALAAGAEHWNVLAGSAGVALVGSGGAASSAVALLPGCTSSQLNVASTTGFGVGTIVAVDVDYSGQTGFVGSWVSGGYATSATQGGIDLVRRLTYNVGKVVAVNGNALQLAAPLIAGVPTASMKVQPVIAFTDREGGSFLQEWSALFVVQGEQGDRLLFHYPRLQACSSPSETHSPLAADLSMYTLSATYRAMAVTDANDQQRAVCYRTYVPAANAAP